MPWAYNGRRASDILSKKGLSFGSIDAQGGGIVTRGVLLDVAAVRGQPWLSSREWVTRQDLEAAEERQTVRTSTGDALFVYAGVEERQASGDPDDGVHRTGLEADAVLWLHEREVAVYSGDCRDFMPYPDDRVPLPLHQVGLVAMGLSMLDIPSVVELRQVCRRLGRSEFMFMCAPLKLPGATGSPVNPVCVF
jgi:kynurenine formamidase